MQAHTGQHIHSSGLAPYLAILVEDGVHIFSDHVRRDVAHKQLHGVSIAADGRPLAHRLGPGGGRPHGGHDSGTCINGLELSVRASQGWVLAPVRKHAELPRNQSADRQMNSAGLATSKNLQAVDGVLEML